MSDVRALLKAKRQEVRIQHPYASYTSTGQLRCAACETAIKQASAWAGHISSKAHRENVAKQRTSQLTNQATIKSTKRKVERDGRLEEDDVDPTSEPKKRKVTPDGLREPTPERSSTFPSDFFSDPSRAPIPSMDDDLGDEDEGASATLSREVTDNPIDWEWQQFRQGMLTSVPAPNDKQHETFKRATVFAEPELLQENVVGLPAQGPPQTDGVAGEVPESEEESRKRKEEEEKELIMDRLLDEERAQEEADAKVALLKGRLDALRKRREEAKATRTKKP